MLPRLARARARATENSVYSVSEVKRGNRASLRRVCARLNSANAFLDGGRARESASARVSHRRPGVAHRARIEAADGLRADAPHPSRGRPSKTRFTHPSSASFARCRLRHPRCCKTYTPRNSSHAGMPSALASLATVETRRSRTPRSARPTSTGCMFARCARASWVRPTCLR